MIGYWHQGEYYSPPNPDPIKMAQYRRHVANGTVPTESQIPYTRTGVEKYRHKSALDDFKPGQPPIYPRWIKAAMNEWKAARPSDRFPDKHRSFTPGQYIQQFYELNGLIP